MPIRSSLQALYDWAGESIATVPQGQRRLVTAHDAFEYFAKAYGMEASEAIEGISTASEASIGDIRELADYVIDKQCRRRLRRRPPSPRARSRRWCRKCVHAVQAWRSAVSSIPTRWVKPGSIGGTYIGMIYENVVTITQALGGTPAALPEALADWAREWDIAQ